MSGPASCPARMFGVVHSQYGLPRDVLHLSHAIPTPKIPIGAAGCKQLLIRIHAVGVNVIDYKILGGAMASVAPLTFPAVPGIDVAGVIVAVGQACKRLKVGDEVYANLNLAGGAMAEYCVVNENQVSLKPSNLTFAEAASAPCVALTSYQALTKYGGLREGESKKILILNGSGGTGSYGIQIAKAYGAHVTVTCSARNTAFCQYLGADQTIDYTRSQWYDVLSPHSIDIIYDCQGEAHSWTHSKQVLKKGGVFVTIAVSDDPSFKFTWRAAMGLGVTLIGRKLAGIFSGRQYQLCMCSGVSEDLDTIRSLFEANQMRPVIEQYYTIQGMDRADQQHGVLDMFQHVMAGRTRGKLVLEIYEPGPRHVFDFSSVDPRVNNAEEEKNDCTFTTTTPLNSK